MTERFCKKCNKMCHCTQAGSENECTNCDCNGREEDLKVVVELTTLENGGVKLILILSLLVNRPKCTHGE